MMILHVLKSAKEVKFNLFMILLLKALNKRKDKHPIILEVNTEKAREEGVKFYLGNEKVWLADEILVSLSQLIRISESILLDYDGRKNFFFKIYI